MRSSSLLALALLVVTVSAYGQEQKAAPGVSKVKKEADRRDELSERQLKASFILDSAVDDVRNVENLDIRITLAEEIVKLLAGRRPERCRQMLDAIFDEIMKLKKTGAPGADSRSSTSINRLISITATFDHKLAQSYIDRFSAQTETPSGDGRSGRLSGPALELQLALARQLLERDSGVAVAVAAATLKTAVIGDTLLFLTELRKKNPGLASEFFASALNSVRLRGGRDINELLLLYSFAFASPRISQMQSQRPVLLQLHEYAALAKGLSVDPSLARQYLEGALEMLSEPSRNNPSGLESLTAGIAGDLYLLQLLAPYANTYMPSLTDKLSRQQRIAAGFLNPDQATQLGTSASKVNAMQDSGPARPDNTGFESVERLSKLAAESTNAGQRDQLFYMAAAIAVKEKKYETALDLVSKISADLRNQAKEFINFSIAEGTVADGDIEKAEQIARRDGDTARQAYILTLIAKALAEGKSQDTVRANELLIEIGQLSKKAVNGDEALAILLDVSRVYAMFDSIRAFETLRDITKEANKLDKWDGNSSVSRMITLGGFGFAYQLYNNGVSLPHLVSRLGAKNFEETLMTVQALKNGVPRLKSLIALCDMVLAQKPAQ